MTNNQQKNSGAQGAGQQTSKPAASNPASNPASGGETQGNAQAPGAAQSPSGTQGSASSDTSASQAAGSGEKQQPAKPAPRATLGRIVHYQQTPDLALAAIVIGSHAAKGENLQVFMPSGGQHVKLEVMPSPNGKPMEGHYHWPEIKK